MDIATISAAYEALKISKEIFSSILDAKIDAGIKQKINSAMSQLGSAQDTLFSLREELFRLQSSNDELRKQLSSLESWQNVAGQYDLTKTSGGAVVYKYKAEPAHYACPSCYNQKQIQILQDNRTISGKYSCKGCNAEFPIDPKEHYSKPTVRNIYDSYDR